MLLNDIMCESLTEWRIKVGEHSWLEELLNFLITIGWYIKQYFEKDVEIDYFRLFNDFSYLCNLFLYDRFTFVVNLTNLKINLFEQKIELIEGMLEKNGWAFGASLLELFRHSFVYFGSKKMEINIFGVLGKNAFVFQHTYPELRG